MMGVQMRKFDSTQMYKRLSSALNRAILTLLHSVRKTRLCGGEVPLLGDWVMGADVMWSLDDRVQVRVYAATP